ncbi:MAG: hypothetical protein ACRD22_18760 [Terriglobia bacterium]
MSYVPAYSGWVPHYDGAKYLNKFGFTIPAGTVQSGIIPNSNWDQVIYMVAGASMEKAFFQVGTLAFADDYSGAILALASNSDPANLGWGLRFDGMIPWDKTNNRISLWNLTPISCNFLVLSVNADQSPLAP